MCDVESLAPGALAACCWGADGVYAWLTLDECVSVPAALALEGEETQSAKDGKGSGFGDGEDLSADFARGVDGVGDVQIGVAALHVCDLTGGECGAAGTAEGAGGIAGRVESEGGQAWTVGADGGIPQLNRGCAAEQIVIQPGVRDDGDDTGRGIPRKVGGPIAGSVVRRHFLEGIQICVKLICLGGCPGYGKNAQQQHGKDIGEFVAHESSPC